MNWTKFAAAVIYERKNRCKTNHRSKISFKCFCRLCSVCLKRRRRNDSRSDVVSDDFSTRATDAGSVVLELSEMDQVSMSLFTPKFLLSRSLTVYIKRMAYLTTFFIKLVWSLSTFQCSLVSTTMNKIKPRSFFCSNIPFSLVFEQIYIKNCMAISKIDS